MKESPVADHLVSNRMYAGVWLMLLILLAATIAVAKLNLLARFSVLGALAIASLKAGLILAFFMHLKYEGRFLKVMLVVTVATLTMFIGLTFVDVWYR
jgi:cytochrome c oxidase subunit 4